MIGGRRRTGVGGMMVLRGGSWLFLVGAGVMARSQGKRGGGWDRKSGKGCGEQGLRLSRVLSQGGTKPGGTC